MAPPADDIYPNYVLSTTTFTTITVYTRWLPAPLIMTSLDTGSSHQLLLLVDANISVILPKYFFYRWFPEVVAVKEQRICLSSTKDRLGIVSVYISSVTEPMPSFLTKLPLPVAPAVLSSSTNAFYHHWLSILMASTTGLLWQQL